MPYPFSRGEILRASDINDAIADARGVGHIFDYIPANRHAGLTARTDTDPIDEYLQEAIDDLASKNGGTLLFPAMHGKLASQLLVKDNNIRLIGQGSSYTRQGNQAHRDAAATRLYWDTTAATPASGTAMVFFQTPSGNAARSGGGIEGIMIDGMATHPVGVHIQTWRAARFTDVFVYACTEDQWLTSVVDYALSSGPADTQRCLFLNCFGSAFGGSGWYLTNEARGWRLTGGSSVNTGNTSFCTFVDCTAYLAKGTGWTLENTDNNYFYNCAGSAAFGATSGYGLILCSEDEDSSTNPSPAHARYNFFIGGQWTALCKASQTGGASSADNAFIGLSRANGADLPVLEAGGGGAADATALVVSNDQIFASSVQGAAANGDMVVGPQGDGALHATSDGSARGLYATDWQRYRTSSAKVAAGAYSVVAGGSNNLAAGSYDVVAGGDNNTASQTYSAVGGGNTNTATGDFAVVAGGRRNTAQGDYCWIPGGGYAETRGMYGRGAWASGDIAAFGDAQVGEHVLRCQTTDATQTRLTGSGDAATTNNTVNLPNNGTYLVRLLVLARQTAGSAGTSGDSAAWETSVLIKRAASAATTAVVAGGGASIAPSLSDAAAGAWRLAVTADTTNGGVLVAGTGEANKTISWVARAMSVETFG